MSGRSGAPTEASVCDWRAGLERLEGAYAVRTLRGLRDFMVEFEAWCGARALACMPASAETVAAYVEAIFPRVAAGTVANRLWYLRAVHRACGQPHATRSLPVKLAVRRGLKTFGGAPRQAHPVNAELLQRLLAVCGEDLTGLRDRALLRLAYDTLCRRAEVVALRIEDLEPLAGGGGSLQVRRSKTDLYGAGQTVHLSPAGLVAVRDWLAAAGLTAGPILRSAGHGAAPGVGAGPLHPATVTARLRVCAARAGVEPAVVRRLSGHSTRVGAAHDLVVEGRTLMEVMRAGRWRSLQAVARYVRLAPVNPWSESGGAGLAHGRPVRVGRADAGQGAQTEAGRLGRRRAAARLADSGLKTDSALRAGSAYARLQEPW